MPPKLSITPTDGEAIILDGAKIIAEEMDGSGKAISLGKLTDDKDESGDAVYHLAEDDDAIDTDNGDFRITNNELFYIGAAVDFESASDDDKSFSIKIIRYKNAEDAEAERSPQTLDSTINLQDVEEALTITPDASATYFSTNENGEAFLDENTDGSTEKLLGTIIDTIATSAVVSYKLAAATASNDNGNFRIDTATGQIYYTGSALDFESLTDKKQLTLQIIRTLDGNAETEQTLQRVINLKNVNDNDPVLTAEGGTVAGEKLEILSDFSDTFGSSGEGFITITLSIPSALVANSLDIVLTRASSAAPLKPDLTPIYQDGANIIEQIAIHYNAQQTAESFISQLKEAFSEHPVLGGYLVDLTTPQIVVGLTGTFTLTTTPTLKVPSGTTGIIADFADGDLDGDLNDFTYSLSDSDDGTDGDSTYFTIDTATGELSFNTAKMPTLTGSQNSNAIYEIKVTVTEVSTEATSDTYPIQIEITAASPSSTASDAAPTAAEAVPDTDDSAAPEATKPSIGRRILDYLFGSQEEHRQMQNQQTENMFSGDSDLDPINPQDPDIL